MFRWNVLIASCALAVTACSSDDDPAGGTSGSGGESGSGGSGAMGGSGGSAATGGSGGSGGSTGDASTDAPSDAMTDAQADAQPGDATTDGETDAGSDASEDAAADRPCTLGGDECEPGEKCAPVGAADALVCRPDGDKQIGQVCGEAGTDDCVSGAACVPYDSSTSTCVALCDGTVACAESYEACFDWFGPDGDVAGICLGDGCEPPAVDCENGERCTVLSTADEAVAACVPAGTVPVGGDCSVEECEPGAMCVQSGSNYVCRPYCEGGADCGADDRHCIWPWPSLPDIGLCRAGCDPVRQTGCSTGEGCYYMDPVEGSTECWTEGTLAEGEDCGSMIEFCLPGLDCVLEPGSSPYEYYCRAYCDDDHPCTTGTCTTTDATSALKFCMP